MLYQTIDKEARAYMYDLMNEAKEHGFKADDKWTLNLATENGQREIRADYYPAVANKVSPEILLPLFQAIKSGLQQTLSKEEMLMDTKSVLDGELNYIIAFNPKRHR